MSTPTRVALGERAVDIHQIASGATGVESDDWVVIVDVVILCLTILGASSILISMAVVELRGRASTTRTRLVQALVLSDLIVGLVGLIGSCMRLDPSNNSLQHGKTSCDGLGVMLVTVLWTEHLWTLSLAFATYMILIYPMHTVTGWLEKKWYLLWVFVWTLAFAVGVLGYELYGYYPSGGICFYGTNAGLYAELMQFIPRCIVLIFVGFFYTRLYVFLKRPDKIRSQFSSDQRTGGSLTTAAGRRGFLPKMLRSMSSRRASETPLSANDAAAHDDVLAAPPNSPDPTTADSRRPSRGRDLQLAELPPWERIELPAFQVNGERFGGASANVQTQTQGSISNGSMWGDWKGLGGREFKKRASTSSSITPLHPAPPTGPRNTGGSASSGGLKLSTIPSNRLPQIDDSPLATFAPLESRRDSDAILQTTGDDDLTTSSSSTRYAQPGNGEAGAADTRRPSEITQPRRESDLSQFPDSRRPSGVGPFATALEDDLELQQGEEQGGEDEWDLMKVLKSTAPPKSFDHGFEVGSDGKEYELVPESMASYLNRKTALLMLWFPLAVSGLVHKARPRLTRCHQYCLLFSVSLVRIIYDFASTDPPVALRAVSRWFIFAQGLFDAIIYGAVEYHTKRVVRKKFRKRGDPDSASGSGLHSAIGSALRGFGRRSQTSPTGSKLPPQQTTSAMSSGGRRNQNVSFGSVGDPRSILQQLDPDRKGS
ncbi:hypothetical protein P7C73_g5303, partial [Tremellales sp. Uapishka_1]